MGNLIRCEAGLHQFDADKYSLCPYCNSRNVDNPAAAGDSEVATRVLQRPAVKAVGSDDPTIPMNRGGGDVPVDRGAHSSSGIECRSHPGIAHRRASTGRRLAGGHRRPGKRR